MADIIIHLRSDTRLPEQLLGHKVSALHPKTTDATLRSIVQMTWPDDQNPDEVVRALRSMPEVDAAYVKPPGSTP